MSNKHELDQVLEGLEQINHRLGSIEQRLDKLEEQSHKLDDHIDFVTDVYQTVQAPLDYICKAVSIRSSWFGDSSNLPSLPKTKPLEE